MTTQEKINSYLKSDTITTSNINEGVKRMIMMKMLKLINKPKDLLDVVDNAVEGFSKTNRKDFWKIEKKIENLKAEIRLGKIKNGVEVWKYIENEAGQKFI